MKKFILLAVVLLFISSYAQADDWEVKGKVYQTSPTDSESIVQKGLGKRLSIHKGRLYFYLSEDTQQVRFAGQGSPDLELWSVGVGLQHHISKYLTLSADVGWYEPRMDGMDEPMAWNSSAFSEGLLRYLNKFLAPENQGGHPWIPNWDTYSINYYGSVGGKLNLDFAYPVTESITLSLSTGYRHLKLLENIKGEDYDGGYARLGEAGCWTIRKDRDFSAWYTGLSITYAF